MAFSERQVKMKKTDPCGSILIPFIFTEAVFYLTFLILDLTSSLNGLSTALKYCSVLLCFGFSLIFARTPDRILAASALGLTVIADAFLLLLDRHYLAGILCFLGVQILYYIRILSAGGFSFLPFLPVRFLLSGCIFPVLAVLHIWDPLSAAAVFYFLQLLLNAAESLFLRHINLQYTLFSAGLLLFVCCDLCVGLTNLSSLAVISVPEPVLSFAQTGMWLFYLPSQVMITLSIYPNPVPYT